MVEETVGSGNGLVPIGRYRSALEQGDEDDSDTPRPGNGHYNEDRVPKGNSDTEETNIEEKNGHFDRYDGERVKYFIAPVQLDS